MSMRLALLAAAAVLSATPALAAVAFENVPGATSPFSAGGVTFAAGAGDFVAGPTVYSSFAVGLNDVSGNFSPTPPYNFVGDTLTLTFAGGANYAAFKFGIDDLGAAIGSDSLTVTSGTGASGTYTASVVGGLFPEGTVSFGGFDFSSLTITSANPYSIGDVTVPEPSALAVLGLGCGALAFARRRG